MNKEGQQLKGTYRYRNVRTKHNLEDLCTAKVAKVIEKEFLK